MSTTTSELRVTMTFEDGTTKTHVIPDVAQDALANVVERVQAINAGTAPNADALKATFVSSEGYEFTEISNVQAVTTTEEVVYSG